MLAYLKVLLRKAIKIYAELNTNLNISKDRQILWLKSADSHPKMASSYVVKPKQKFYFEKQNVHSTKRLRM